MSPLRFDKYEGLGNDFVVVDEATLGGAQVGPVEARRLCDRHFGVGGDGVLLVGPPRSPGSMGAMIVLNADGSRPEMCGNGLRCVAAFLAARAGFTAGSFVVDTDSGPLGCEVELASSHHGAAVGALVDAQVAIDMGVASLVGPVSLAVDGRVVQLERVSTGNPHAVTFGPHREGDLHAIGAPLAVHPAFAEGSNVELVHDEPDGSLRVQVWERGVGPTLACGTGACAAAVASCARGLRPFGRELTVHLPGGPLHITVAPDLRVRMRGPARLVFRGSVEICLG